MHCLRSAHKSSSQQSAKVKIESRSWTINPNYNPYAPCMEYLPTYTTHGAYPIGSMYGIYGNIYHEYTPNVSIYTSTMDPTGYDTLSLQTERVVNKIEDVHSNNSTVNQMLIAGTCTLNSLPRQAWFWFAMEAHSAQCTRLLSTQMSESCGWGRCCA